jgi:hypothetical protein
MKMICNKADECKRICEHKIKHYRDSLGGNFMCTEQCDYEETRGAVCVPVPQPVAEGLRERWIEERAKLKCPRYSGSKYIAKCGVEHCLESCWLDCKSRCKLVAEDTDWYLSRILAEIEIAVKAERDRLIDKADEEEWGTFSEGSNGGYFTKLGPADFGLESEKE